MRIWLTFIGMLLLFNVNAQSQERLPQFYQHVVAAGETPSSIAAKYGIKKRDFLLLNDFPESVKLKPGSVVLIRQLNAGETQDYGDMGSKKKSEPQQTQPTSKAKEEIVASKNEAPKRVEKNEVKETKVKEAEKSEKTERVEKEKTTPTPGASTQVGPGGVSYNVTGAGYHIVEKGQTFYRIALIYGLSIDELKALNNMSNTTISVGQKLKVSK